MRHLASLALIASLVPAPLAAQAPLPSRSDSLRAVRVLRRAPVFDAHNDLPWRIREDTIARGNEAAYDLRATAPGMTDLARLRAGFVGGQFWSVYIPGEPRDPTYRANGAVTSTPGYARVQLEQIEIARRVIARYPELAWTPTLAEARGAMRRGRIASMLGLEGGHAIENSLAVLRQYHALGARYMTLTHNVTLDWADAAMDSARHGGLTDFGRDVVREMNRLGMLVDLSHVSPGTMSDALDASTAPVIFTHSAARALVDAPRNIPDSILARLPRNGGVVMIPFVTAFVSPRVKAHEDTLAEMIRAAVRRHGSDSTAIRRDIEEWVSVHPTPPATIGDVADHIEHVRRVAGVDHVGIGADFDGITNTVVGLQDVSTYPALFAELARRGWSDRDLARLSNGNVMRVIDRAEAVARRCARGGC